MQKRNFREGRRRLQIWISQAQTQAQTQPPTQNKFPFAKPFFHYSCLIVLLILSNSLFDFVVFVDPFRQGGLPAGPTLYFPVIFPKCILDTHS